MESMDVYKFLRYYQVDAIKTIKKYMASSSRKDCLIKLPTGTGKTGIMAVSANMLSKKNTLIIVPNATLPYQTKEEISTLFWRKIAYTPSTLKVVTIINGSNDYMFDFSSDSGYIAIVNIQTLTNIYANNNALFELFSRYIDIVFYDEGHREPANEWSIISRKLCKKTILFTATPYRNDHHIFNIDKNFIFEYSIATAIKDGFVKNPEFKPIPNNIITDIFLLSKYLHEIIMVNKTLIRLEGSKKIKDLKNALDVSLKVACCHSNYTSSPHFYNQGEKLLKHSAEYDVIIHSDMLCEGINISALNTLVCLDCYKNTKTMIQQIGRILRPNEINKAYIYLPEDLFDEITEQWHMYVLADDDHDNYIYFDGKFRSKFELCQSINIHEEISYQKQANVFFSQISYMDMMKENIKSMLFSLESFSDINESDYVNGSHNLWTLCYQRNEPSKHLLNKYYYNTSFEYLSLLEIKKGMNFYYFYYNSRRYSLPFPMSELQKISPNEIYNLLPNNSEVKSVSFSSTSNQKIGAHNRLIKGGFLNSLPSTLQERMSFCKNTTGKFETNQSKIQRYLGATTAKVSDKDACNYKEYIEWCIELLTTFSSGIGNHYFSRFSQVVKAPVSLPTSILIDLSTIVFHNGEKIILDSQYCTINNNRFDFYIDDNIVSGQIIRETNENIRILLSGLDSYYYEDGMDLSKCLEYNNFCVYFADVQIIYTNGIYFRPNIRYHYEDVNDFELFGNIVAISALEMCSNEKLGNNPSSAFNSSVSWPLDSVFGVLINEIEKSYPSIDYLLCDDMGCEIADFIAIDSHNKKIMFIHCKHKKSKLSASAFQDLCGQAIKNIEYLLTTDPTQEPYITTHLNKWKSNWSLTNDSIEYKSQRCILGKADDFFNEYIDLMKNPITKKEVWLYTSGLSKKSLEYAMTKKKPEEQYVQLMYLLQLTQDSIAQAGANLKIFCSK